MKTYKLVDYPNLTFESEEAAGAYWIQDNPELANDKDTIIDLLERVIYVRQ